MTENEFNESDLIPALHKIFSGADVKRISEIHEILKGRDITAKKDLVIIDVEQFKDENILSDAEVLKIDAFLEENYKEQFHKNKERMELEKSKNLLWVLKRIFSDTSDERLAEIKSILKKELIHSGLHMKIVDTNKLRKNTSLTDIEILSIEEYIKKNNRERYDEIKAAKRAEDEINFARLKRQDEINFYKLTKTEELKFAQEEQKMIEYKANREIELKEASVKEEMERENMKLEREMKLMEAMEKQENMKLERELKLMDARTKEEMKKEDMKIKHEKELMETKAKIERDIENMKIEREKQLREEKRQENMAKEKIKWQREMELREAEAKEERERLHMEMQREKELMEAKTKEEIEREKINIQKEINAKCCNSLLNEKKCLMDEVRDLENERNRLMKVIAENSKTGIRGFFSNDLAKLNRARRELEETKAIVITERSRIAEIDKQLMAGVHFK